MPNGAAINWWAFETLPVLALPYFDLFSSFQFALSARLFLAFVGTSIHFYFLTFGLIFMY
jgi:hypothetical protein